MATYFGEILEPVSRAFVTDGEECSLEERYSIESENEINPKGSSYQYLFITSGRVLSDFAAVYLIPDNVKVLQKFNIVPILNGKKISNRNKMSLTLYLLTNDTLLFVCEQLPHLYFAHKILFKLIPWIESTNHVIVLNSENMALFKPRKELQPFVQCLRTRSCSLTAHAPNLELPNTISGLPAAVISWSQANKKSALLYIIYLESSSLDSVSAEPLVNLMKTLNFQNLLTKHDTKVLKSIVNNTQLQHSNLYL